MMSVHRRGWRYEVPIIRRALSVSPASTKVRMLRPSCTARSCNALPSQPQINPQDPQTRYATNCPTRQYLAFDVIHLQSGIAGAKHDPSYFEKLMSSDPSQTNELPSQRLEPTRVELPSFPTGLIDFDHHSSS